MSAAAWNNDNESADTVAEFVVFCALNAAIIKAVRPARLISTRTILSQLVRRTPDKTKIVNSSNSPTAMRLTLHALRPIVTLIYHATAKAAVAADALLAIMNSQPALHSGAVYFGKFEKKLAKRLIIVQIYV